MELASKIAELIKAKIPEDKRDIVDDTSELSNSQNEIHDYKFVRDRQKRVIKTTKRYGFADLIAYALTIAHNFD